MKVEKRDIQTTSILYTLFVFLKENNIQSINIRRLNTFLQEMSKDEYFGYMLKNRNFLDADCLNLFTHAGILEEKTNQLYAYTFAFDLEKAKKDIAHNAKIVNIMIEKLAIGYLKYNKTREVDNQSFTKGHITNLKKFLFAFTCILQENGINLLDDDAFKKTFGCSFYESNELQKALQKHFQREMVVDNLNKVISQYSSSSYDPNKLLSEQTPFWQRTDELGKNAFHLQIPYEVLQKTISEINVDDLEILSFLTEEYRSHLFTLQR